ncbi:hypothetical protein [Vibrio sp.]|uniref:hypothetical protein n=1 Tax=Vibrio sp. TaxID=678 RepID=UPI0037DC419B
MGIQATNRLYELIDSESGKPELIEELERTDKEFDIERLPDEWKKEVHFIEKWARLKPLFTGVDLTAAAYLSRQNIPMGSVNSVMSGAAQKMLEGLLKQKTRSSKASSELIELTASEEYISVMDSLIEELRKVEEWDLKTSGIYGARQLAAHDDRCKANFLAFVKKAPKKRWLESLIKELEATK